MVENSKRSEAVHTKSLALLLGGSADNKSSLFLSRHDRLFIAVTLASSVLQLEKTSWLKRQWRSCDISFHCPDGSNVKASKKALAYPYISWKASAVMSDLESSTECTLLKKHLIRSEALFALGLVLDKDSNEAITELYTARRLLDRVYDESGGNYGDVVCRCLFCPFDVREASLDNDDFQQAVFDDIVTPLFNDLEAFEGPRKGK